jgi:hypothetical protein
MSISHEASHFDIFWNPFYSISLGSEYFSQHPLFTVTLGGIPLTPTHTYMQNYSFDYFNIQTTTVV